MKLTFTEHWIEISYPQMPDASGSRYPRVFSAKRARHLLPQGKPQDNQGKWGGRIFCSLAPFTAQRKSCWIHNLLKIMKSKQLISEPGYSVVLLSFLVAINIKKEISLLIDCYKMLHWLWRRTIEEKELIFIVLVITPTLTLRLLQNYHNRGSRAQN